MDQAKISHLVSESVEDVLVMGLTDAHADHVPQIPQHGHEGKRLVVCAAETAFISMFDLSF